MLITDLFVPPELMQSTVDVERQTAAGVDGSGAPVEVWTKIYSNLPCAVDPRPAGDPVTFGKKSAEFNVPCYFSRQDDGTLPDIRDRDRLVFGKWPNGATRYLIVNEALDELGAGVVLVCSCSARAPG